MGHRINTRNFDGGMDNRSGSKSLYKKLDRQYREHSYCVMYQLFKDEQDILKVIAKMSGLKVENQQIIVGIDCTINGFQRCLLQEKNQDTSIVIGKAKTKKENMIVFKEYLEKSFENSNS